MTRAASLEPPMSADTSPPVYGNIALRLRESAGRWPHQRAVVVPAGRDEQGRVSYSHLTFEQLERESDRLARGLSRMGVEPGKRIVLAVRPGLEFIALTFALFKTGAVIVLIDPGMGKKNVFDCLAEVEPDGFVAFSKIQAIRALMPWRFRRATLNATVGRRWFWRGPNYRELLGEVWTPFELPNTRGADPAAIIFTSGSTGPPKGVLYEHGMFNAQVDLLRDFYDIPAGEIDLPGFPLFALFNAAMGVTTVIPDMDPMHPADVEPLRIIEAIRDQGVTQAFGSPAMWNRIGRYCEANDVVLPSLQRVLSAGAPVPNHVLRRIRGVFRESRETDFQAVDPCFNAANQVPDIHTPYGATESLPVCSISGREVLEATDGLTRQGAGTCVGRPFPRVRVKIIGIADDTIPTLNEATELATGEIGEIIVQSPSTTREYFRRPEATAAAKIADGEGFWHRMGDVGYFDETGRLWFCGRKAHIVDAETGRMYSVRCEAIFNEHPHVYRSALVGVGAKPKQCPVIVVEPEEGRFPNDADALQQFEQELRDRAQGNPLTATIETFLFHPSLPVDIRHNTKIRREELAEWATGQLAPTLRD